MGNKQRRKKDSGGPKKASVAPPSKMKPDKLDELTILEDTATSSPNENAALSAVEKIDDERALERIAWFSVHESVAMAAVEKITDEGRLEAVACFSKHESIALCALEKIENQGIRRTVAIYSEHLEVSVTVVENTDSILMLKQIRDAERTGKEIRELAEVQIEVIEASAA